MLKTKYLTMEDFAIVDVATHCDWKKLNISIQDALNFDFPELLCQYYQLALDCFESDDPTPEQLKLLSGDNFECGKVTRRFLGLKNILVYYSYANYLMNSVLTDTGIGFVAKTDNFSVPTPYKDVKDITNSYRNRGFSVIKQLKEYISHNQDLAKNYNIKLDHCDCGCEFGDCELTEKRIYVFKPKIISK